eukprot:3498118-Rhodomonas_salina.1
MCGTERARGAGAATWRAGSRSRCLTRTSGQSLMRSDRVLLLSLTPHEYPSSRSYSQARARSVSVPMHEVIKASQKAHTLKHLQVSSRGHTDTRARVQ